MPLGYYGPSSFSSYSAPYLSGPYAKHSSIIAANYSRPPSTYTKPLPRIRLGFTPLLATISEAHAAARPLSRITSPKLVLHSSPKFKMPRPISINTADIDVSVNKYSRSKRLSRSPEGNGSEKLAEAEVQSGRPSPAPSPTPPPTKATENGEEVMTRSPLRRDRAIVRIHTIHKRSKKKEPAKEPSQPQRTRKWRENYQEDEEPRKSEKKERRVEKSPAERLLEKHLIKDKAEEERLRLIAEEQKRREDNLKVHAVKKSSKKEEGLEKSPSFHDICKSISSDSINNDDLNPGQPEHIKKRQSRQSSTDDVLKKIRRDSAEILQENVILLDKLIMEAKLDKQQKQQEDNKKTKDTTSSNTDSSKQNENTQDFSRTSIKRKKKITRKKTNESLTSDSEEPPVANTLQRRPTLKKIKRTSTDSSLTSETSPVDPLVEDVFQYAIRDISQVEVEEIKLKPKQVITSTVDFETPKPSLKMVVDEVEIEEKPKPKPAGPKFKLNFTIQDIEEKRRSIHEGSKTPTPTLEKESGIFTKNVTRPSTPDTEKVKTPSTSDAEKSKLPSTPTVDKSQSPLTLDLEKVKTPGTPDSEKGKSPFTPDLEQDKNEKASEEVKTSFTPDVETNKTGQLEERNLSPKENIQKNEAMQLPQASQPIVSKVIKKKHTAHMIHMLDDIKEEDLEKQRTKQAIEQSKAEPTSPVEVKTPPIVTKILEKVERDSTKEQGPSLNQSKPAFTTTPDFSLRKSKTEVSISLPLQSPNKANKEDSVNFWDLIGSRESTNFAQRRRAKKAPHELYTTQKSVETIAKTPEKDIKLTFPAPISRQTSQEKSKLADRSSEKKKREEEQGSMGGISKTELKEEKDKVEEKTKQPDLSSKLQLQEEQKNKVVLKNEAEAIEGKPELLQSSSLQLKKDQQKTEAIPKPTTAIEEKPKLLQSSSLELKEEQEKTEAKPQPTKAIEEKPKLLQSSSIELKEEQQRTEAKPEPLDLSSKLELKEEKQKIEEMPKQLELKNNALLTDQQQKSEAKELDQNSKTMVKEDKQKCESDARTESKEIELKTDEKSKQLDQSIRREKQQCEQQPQEQEASNKIATDGGKPEHQEEAPVLPVQPRGKMISKRSLVNKAAADDPDLNVFAVPEEPQEEPEETEEQEEEDAFVPLQSNRISGFMHPFKKPAQLDVCPLEIYATPKVIRYRHIPRPKHPPPPPSPKDESESDSSESEESSDESDSSEDDTNVTSKAGTSTSSNDSGFDSSAPGSPSNRRHNKGSSESRDSPTANPAHNPAFAVDAGDVVADEILQSSTFVGYQKSGRITPPATTIPRFRKYTIDDFQFLKVLGKGSFGKVLLAELKNTEYYYAVKCLKKDVVLEDDDVECTLIERKVLALGTKHPYLCHLLCTFQTESHLFFVMEYLNGGDLMFHIQQSGRFPEARARFYAAEIASGLKFLHTKGIVYRDLKLDNILLDFDGHVRIADFGMCKLQIFLDRTADTFCGTPDYMAPEIIKGQHYNQSVDWWSYGVLLYEMLIGQSPFSGCDEDELFWSICNEKPLIPRYLSAEANSILLLFLEKDASKRLGNRMCPSGDIQDQPFFKQIAWDRLEARLLEPPFKPKLQHPLDTQYFDKTFTVEKAKLTPIEKNILQSMDQTQFQGFSYTNPNATDK